MSLDVKFISLDLKGLILIELTVRRDERGFFAERFHAVQFEQYGLPTQFVQDNHSRSVPGVLRGLHYQHNPSQGKLIGVTRGRVWDVVVDIREDSPTFGKYSGIELSDKNGWLLWVPPGFAHGFCVLGEEPADVMYKVDSLYHAEGEGGLYWKDPDLAIPWPVKDPIVSPKDQWLSSFATYKAAPVQWELEFVPGQKLRQAEALLDSARTQSIK
jgi:dTDP-4-dehydrorhamnose 3,5-epimerase